MLTGTNLTYTKEYNLRIVHETIRVLGPLSRSEIARRTELTVQTVSNLVKHLLAMGLVYEAERRQEGRGAPSVSLALNPDGAFAIGLDLDRDHLTGVLIDLSGKVRQRIHKDLDFPSPEDALELMVEMAGDLSRLQGLTIDRVWGVGIGIPGPMHLAGDGTGSYVINPKAYPGWENVPIATWINERLKLPVFVENNATAAAMGERWYGSGQQIRNFFYIYVGSGLGGGFVLNGHPYEGVTGNAGEIGYLPAPGDGAEGHVGVHFFMPRLYQRLQEDGVAASTPEDLDRLFDTGHPLLLEWIDTASDRLTSLALAIEYLLDPEAIFFGGRLPDSILNEMRERVCANLPRLRIEGSVANPRYLLATAGADAAALGVATLPIYEFFAPAPRVLLKQGENHRGAGFALQRVVSA